MHVFLRKSPILVPLILMTACAGRQEPAANGPAVVSTNAAVFDPTVSNVPLPNILATATAADPLTGRAANSPMNPLEAMAYINKYEVGGTNAVSGVNAPIYLQFEYPLLASTVNASNIKVFQITPDAAGTENSPLTFADVSAMFTYQYAAGSTNVWLFPNFPMQPGTRYLYVVTNRVMDASTGAPIIPSAYFQYLQSTTPLTGATAALEPIRANVTAGSNILLSGYAKVMDDLIAAKSTTTISSRASIAVMGRFITSGAGFVAPFAASPSTLFPVEAALRSFAVGTTLPPTSNPLQGKTWANTITVGTTFTKGNANPALDVGAYWQGATGAPAATVPSTVGTIVLGTINSAFLGLDPVVVKANKTTMDETAVAATAFNPPAGVLQAFRDASGNLQGYYHVPGTIPFVYVAPASAAPAGGYPLVIYQHGITSQKETVLALAQALTSKGFAVVAIDLPMHGALAPSSLQIQAGDSAATKSAKQAGWGQAFMAVGAPLATRTNIQQGAFDLDRLELTARFGGFLALGAAAPSMTNLHFVGISLGSIVGAYYLAGNTTLALSGLPYSQTTLNNDMKGFLSVPGARTAYLIQASPAFGATIDAGLAAVGIAKGTPTYHQFFQTTQTVVDTTDPATMTTPLGAGLPSRLSGRLLMQEATSTAVDASGNPTNGDLVITNPYNRYFGNALGGEAVLGTAAAAAVAPGFAQVGYGATGSVPAKFMLTLSAGTPVFKTVLADLTLAPTGPLEGYFQYNQTGIAHGSLLDPSNPTNAALIQTQMVFFMGATGASIVVDPTDLPALPLNVGAPAGATRVQVAEAWPILVPVRGN